MVWLKTSSCRCRVLCHVVEDFTVSVFEDSQTSNRTVLYNLSPHWKPASQPASWPVSQPRGSFGPAAIILNRTVLTLQVGRQLVSNIPRY